MGSTALKNEILQTLANNIKNNRSPKPVASETIARELEISLSQLVNVLKTMNESGTIISDMDNHYSIITAAGMSQLQNRGMAHHAVLEGVGQHAYTA